MKKLFSFYLVIAVIFISSLTIFAVPSGLHSESISSFPQASSDGSHYAYVEYQNIDGVEWAFYYDEDGKLVSVQPSE